jgi:hypothetical protein
MGDARAHQESDDVLRRGGEGPRWPEFGVFLTGDEEGNDELAASESTRARFLAAQGRGERGAPAGGFRSSRGGLRRWRHGEVERRLSVLAENVRKGRKIVAVAQGRKGDGSRVFQGPRGGDKKGGKVAAAWCGVT